MRRGMLGGLGTEGMLAVWWAEYSRFLVWAVSVLLYKMKFTKRIWGSLIAWSPSRFRGQSLALLQGFDFEEPQKSRLSQGKCSSVFCLVSTQSMGHCGCCRRFAHITYTYEL